MDPIILLLLIIMIIACILEKGIIYRYKRLLNQYERMRKKLYETSEKISKCNDEDEIYSIVLDTIIDLIPNATKGSVLILKEDNKFHFKVVKGYQKELVNFTIKKEEAYLNQINQFKEAAIVKNPREFDKKHTEKGTVDGLQKINALDISCTLTAPIYIDSTFIGLINVDSIKPNHTFSEKDLDLMNQIKCELELAIKNSFAQRQLEYLANYDELTGLMNRRTFKQEFDKELKNLESNPHNLSLVMMDIDNFKYFNDTYGHYFGDLVLKHFSTVLKNSINKTDLVARFAGDEFVILFKGYDYDMAEEKMKSIVNEVTAHRLDGTAIEFSYGICEVNPNDKNANYDRTLSNADAKMYEQKNERTCNKHIII